MTMREGRVTRRWEQVEDERGEGDERMTRRKGEERVMRRKGDERAKEGAKGRES